MIKKTFIPAKGRNKFGDYPQQQAVIKATSGGGGGGGVGNNGFINAMTTSSGDTAGTWTVDLNAHTLTEIADGTTVKIKLSTDHTPITGAADYNTLDIGLPFTNSEGTAETGETRFLVWNKYNEPLQYQYGLDDELMLTFRENAGAYTTSKSGYYPIGTVITKGWIVESDSNKWKEEKQTISGNTIQYLSTEYHVKSEGDICSYGMDEQMSALTEFNVHTTVTGCTEEDDTQNIAGSRAIWELDNKKQDKLVSGVNIKTINNISLLGEGNIVIQGGGGTGSTVDWQDVQNKPDTLEGYGITTGDTMLQGFVHTTGDEDIDGTKTFEENIIGEKDIACYGEIPESGITSITLVDNLDSTSTSDALAASVGSIIKNQYQRKLIAGTNISIVNNVISATGGGSAQYTAGSGITISNNSISVDYETVAFKDYVNDNFVNITGNQTITGQKTFSQNIIGNGDVVCYGQVPETGITSIDIIDNLSSSRANAALSANQGRLLNASKQNVLVSGNNIKTINGLSLLGSGNIEIQGGGGGTEYYAGNFINISPSHYISAVTGTTASTLAVGNHTHSQYSTTGHTHDDRYYTESEIDTKLSGKSNTGHTHSQYSPTGHTHDDRYYTESEVDTMLQWFVHTTGDEDIDGTKTFKENIIGNKDVVCYGEIPETGVTSIDIIDNLTSTRANAALSARQGKALNDAKQNTLVSGSNIKTINGLSLLGSGNIEIQGGGEGSEYYAGNFINISPTHYISAPTGTTANTLAVGNHTHSQYSTTGHTHDDRYYTESEVDTKLSGKSNTGHGHMISDITNLQNALNGKSDTGHTHSGYAPSSHGHTWSEISNKPSIPTKTSQLTNDSGFLTQHQDISGKSDIGHGHMISDISNLQNALNGKSDTGHTHSGYAPSSHGHTWSEISNKPSIPTKTSDLTNDSGFITSASIPTKTSQLTNDSGFLTQHQDISGKANTNGSYPNMSVGNASNAENSTKWGGYKIVVNGSGSANDCIYFFT